MPPWGKVSRKLAQGGSARLIRLIIRKGGSKIAGKILLGSGPWIKAFEHIAEHFERKWVFQKGTHGVFLSALRSRGALEPLIKIAVTKPSRKIVGRTAVNGVFAGRVCVILEREFAEAIGQELKLEAGGAVSELEAKILRVIVDINGKPVTAFPVASFFK
jgi:hypothetical protein